METNKDVGSQINELLKKHKVSPNNNVWEQLEIGLKEKRKKRRVLILWLFSGSAILIISSMLIFNNFSNTKSNNNSSTQLNRKENLQNINIKTEQKINTQSAPVPYQIVKKINTNQTTINNKINKPKKNYNNLSSLNENNTKKSRNTYLVKNNKQANNFKNTNSSQENTYKTNTTQNKKTAHLTKEDQKNNISIVEKKEEEEELLDKKSKLNPFKKWSVYPYVSLDYYSNFNTSLKNNTTINYGIYLNYLATEGISLRIGVKKLNFEYTLQKQSVTTFQELSYIEIPIEAKYRIINKKISVSAIIGISYLIMEDANIITNNTRDSNNNQFSDSGLSINAGFGFKKQIINKLNLNVEPIFKYHFKTYREQSDLSIFTVSILAGLEYHF